MKKIYIASAFLLLGALTAKAQDSRIRAILENEPAANAAALNANAAATAGLGEQGIADMIAMLQPAGQGDNTRIYDAISGFSFYITQNAKEQWRSMAVRSYSRALSKVNDKVNQAFIISQFQIVGKDDAVAALKGYLNDERLCDPAARALVKVNTPLSKAALLSALKTAAGNCKLSLVEALGDSKNPLALKSISGLTGTDKKLDKVALYALANIADWDISKTDGWCCTERRFYF